MNTSAKTGTPRFVESMKDEINAGTVPSHSEAAGNGTDTEHKTKLSPTVEGIEAPDINIRRTLRKMDIRLLPMMAILYLFSFLDRGNIGNARVLGMSKDLHLVGNQYNLALTVFFFTYIFFEVPSNLVLKKIGPSIWLPTIMIGWGAVTIGMGTVKDYHGLLIARIFLGIAEAGLYPGVAYYLTMFYAPRDLGFRQGLFFSAASIAGAFSGLLAYGISHMDGVGGYAGWRWIFIIEGLATVAIGGLSFFLIYDSPETAKFLSEPEKAWVVSRTTQIGVHKSGSAIHDTEKFEWRYVWQAFADWHIWLGVLIGMGNSCVIYGMSFFLPTIVNELGYSGQSANLLTIPVYVCASIVVIVLCFFSDRRRRRSTFLISLMSIEIVGFILAIAGSSVGGVPGLVYAGVFIATSCCYAGFVLNVTWIVGNLAPLYKRAAGSAFLIAVGNFSGVIGSNIYRTQDAPKFILGHALEIAFISLGLTSSIILRMLLRKENRKREVGHGAEEKSPWELSEMGDRAPTFRYMI